MAPRSRTQRKQLEAPVQARGRRSNAEAAQTRERILDAALDAFSQRGFGATSLRQIAERAGGTQQLISHHFETKLGLWKAVADRLFGELAASLGGRMRGLEGVSLPERLRLLIHAWVRFSADHPEVARFMMHEGATRGPRLEWLVERHVGPLFQAMQSRIGEAQTLGLVPAGDPIHVAYLLIGAMTLFSQAAEFELLTGQDVRAPERVDAHAALVLEMLLPGVGRLQGEARNRGSASASPDKETS